MPIYEYACKECGHQFELMQKMSDSPVQKCEKCHKKKAHRKISQTSFLLKGKGWYATDYAGKKVHGKSDPKPESSSKSKETPACPAASTCASGSCHGQKAS